MPAVRMVQQFFKAADFTHEECVVFFKNVTTSTESSVGQGGLITEITEKGLVLQLARGSCSPGHALVLYFFRKDECGKIKSVSDAAKSKKQMFSATARVSEVGACGQDRCLVTVELKQYVERDWFKFLAFFAAIQARVSDVVRRIKE